MNNLKGKTVYVYREHNYGDTVCEELDVCGDLVVLSDAKSASDIVAEKIFERVSAGGTCRKYFISETNMRPDFPANSENITKEEVQAVVDEELKHLHAGGIFYIRLYPDFPDNDAESLAYVIEKKIIDNIDVL